MADIPVNPAVNIDTTQESNRLVTLLHTERRMRIYGVTENELRTLTLINLAVAALFSIGTGFLGYGLDLHKDLLMTVNIPDKARVLPAMVEPAAFIASGAFYLLGLIVWLIRRGFISTITKESA